MSQLFVSLFQKHIEDVLRDYIEGDLDIAWKQEVSLSHLKLKTTALSKLALPVTIKSGWVGSLNIKVPPLLHALSRPVQVTLEDVFIVAGAVDEFDELDEAHQRNIQKASRHEDMSRQEDVESVEIVAEIRSEHEEATGEGSSSKQEFWGQTVQGIKDNIQVHIKNVHIRFEDDFQHEVGSQREHHAIGLTLQHFALRTSNEKWSNSTFGSREQFVKRDANGETIGTLRREAEVRGLALYWDDVSQNPFDAAEAAAPAAPELPSALRSRLEEASQAFGARRANLTGRATATNHAALGGESSRRSPLGRARQRTTSSSAAIFTSIDLGDRKRRETFKAAIEGEADILSFGCSAQHNFVLSPFSVRMHFTEGDRASTAEVARKRAQQSSLATDGFQEVPANINLNLKIGSINLSLDEGQYTALTNILYYVEWYNRCVRYRAGGAGNIGVNRPSRPPLSRTSKPVGVTRREPKLDGSPGNEAASSSEAAANPKPGRAAARAVARARARARLVLGLRWVNLGPQPPPRGQELADEKLSRALESSASVSPRPDRQRELTKAELDSLGVHQLHSDDYIRVGQHYFRPVGLTAAGGALPHVDSSESVGRSANTPRDGPNALQWWHYACACVRFNIERAGSNRGQKLQARVTRRRFLELYKSTCNRPWRPALRSLPVPPEAAFIRMVKDGDVARAPTPAEGGGDEAVIGAGLGSGDDGQPAIHGASGTAAGSLCRSVASSSSFSLLASEESLGMRWVDAGSMAPSLGKQLVNGRLQEALVTRSEFSRSELSAFDVDGLTSSDDFIFVTKLGRYFKPNTTPALWGSGSVPGRKGRSRGLNGNLATQAMIEAELTALQADMPLADLFKARNTALLQLAVEDARVYEAFGGFEQCQRRLEPARDEGSWWMQGSRRDEGAFVQPSCDVEAAAEESSGASAADSSWRSAADNSFGASPLSWFSGSAASSADTSACRPSACQSPASIASVRVTIHRARRLHKPKYPKLTTYVRVSIAGRSEYRYTREVKSNENPIYGGKAEGQTLPALPIGPGGMDGKLLHVVVFATSSFGGDEAIGELMISLGSMQAHPQAFVDEWWPYNLSCPSTIKGFEGRAFLGAMNMSAQHGVATPPGALFLTAQLENVATAPKDPYAGFDLTAEGVADFQHRSRMKRMAQVTLGGPRVSCTDSSSLVPSQTSPCATITEHSASESPQSLSSPRAPPPPTTSTASCTESAFASQASPCAAISEHSTTSAAAPSPAPSSGVRTCTAISETGPSSGVQIPRPAAAAPSPGRLKDPPPAAPAAPAAPAPLAAPAAPAALAAPAPPAPLAAPAAPAYSLCGCSQARQKKPRAPWRLPSHRRSLSGRCHLPSRPQRRCRHHPCQLHPRRPWRLQSRKWGAARQPSMTCPTCVPRLSRCKARCQLRRLLQRPKLLLQTLRKARAQILLRRKQHPPPRRAYRRPYRRLRLRHHCLTRATSLTLTLGHH